MGDQNLRVWEVDGDTYGEEQSFPRHAKYRMEPQYPGASGDKNTDLVIYERDEAAENGENELARFTSSEVLVAFAGQPTPGPILDAANQPPERKAPTASKAKAGTSTSSDKK